MDSINMVSVFRALSCKKRFAIVKLLLTKACCVGTIAEELKASQSSISQHLRVLRYSGLVTDHRDGNHIHYQANKELLIQLTQTLSDLLNAKMDQTECSRKGILCADVIAETQETT